jgi:hypothetical protein
VQLGSLDRAQDRAQDGAQGAGWTGRKGQRDLRAYDAVARRLLEAPWRTSPGGPGAHHPAALAHITRRHRPWRTSPASYLWTYDAGDAAVCEESAKGTHIVRLLDKIHLAPRIPPPP